MSPRQKTSSTRAPERAPSLGAGYQTRALARGLALLGAFTVRRPQSTLTELAELTGLDKATALRLLRSLEQFRFVERVDEIGHYRLGLKVFELAAAFHGTHWLAQAARPALEALAQGCQQTSELGVLDDGDIVALAVAYPPRPLRRHVTLGERFPASGASIGKVLLADLPSDRLAAFLSAYPPVAATPKTITDVDRLTAEIRAAGQRGYALDDEETLTGVSCVAAPIRDPTGRVVAAINVSGPSAEFRAERLQRHIAEVTTMATTVSARLGYMGDAAARSGATGHAVGLSVEDGMDASGVTQRRPAESATEPWFDRLGQRLGLLGWLLPAYLAMFGISAYPLAHNLISSFFGEAAIGQPAPFVGFRNYQAIVTTPAFFGAVGRTLIWTVGVVGIAFLVGLGMALLLNQRFVGVRLARVLFLIPWATPSIASAIIWRYLYNTDFGIINVGLRGVGLEMLALGWMTDPKVSLAAAMLAHIWRTYGFYMIMLLGALQAVPRDLIEAAMIDGAGPWRRLIAVTLPQIQPVVVMVILLELIWVTNNFDTIFVLTGGGPLRSSETLPLFVYQTAFQSTRFAEAAAGSVLLFLIALSLIAAYLAVLGRVRGREEAL